MIRILLGAALIMLLTINSSFAGCGACGPAKVQQEKAEVIDCSHCKPDAPCEMHMKQTGMMKQASLNYVYTAKKLYHCPSKPNVVFEGKNADCASCGEDCKLKKMSKREIKELRASHPKGCAMCSYVVAGDADEDKCPTCGMVLNTIEHDHPKTMSAN